MPNLMCKSEVVHVCHFSRHPSPFGGPILALHPSPNLRHQECGSPPAASRRPGAEGVLSVNCSPAFGRQRTGGDTLTQKSNLGGPVQRRPPELLLELSIYRGNTPGRGLCSGEARPGGSALLSSINPAGRKFTQKGSSPRSSPMSSPKRRSTDLGHL